MGSLSLEIDRSLSKLRNEWELRRLSFECLSIDNQSKELQTQHSLFVDELSGLPRERQTQISEEKNVATDLYFLVYYVAIFHSQKDSSLATIVSQVTVPAQEEEEEEEEEEEKKILMRSLRSSSIPPLFGTHSQSRESHVKTSEPYLAPRPTVSYSSTDQNNTHGTFSPLAVSPKDRREVNRRATFVLGVSVRRTARHFTAVPGVSRTMSHFMAVPGANIIMNQLASVQSDINTMNHFMAVPGANITMNHLTTLSGARRTMNQLMAVPGAHITMNHLITLPGAHRTMNPLTTVLGDSRTMNQLTAVLGGSRTKNQLNAVLCDSRTMNQLTSVPGDSRTMNQLTAVPGDSRTMNQLTAVPGDSRTMNQLLAVSDDSRTIEHPLTVSGARSAMNNITIFMLAAFLLLDFPTRSQACPEPLTCLSREECVSQLRGHTQAQTDILFVCSSAHGKNTICCPAVESLEEWDASSTVAVTLRSSVHPSMHLMPSGDACDVISLDRIRNGIVAKQGQFPWMTLLGYRCNKPVFNTTGSEVNKGMSDGKLYFLCGGTLINRRYVLTAAHCLQPEGATLELVRLGELDTSTEQDCEEPYPGEKICADPVLDINIEKVVKHKRFNIPFLKNDIALLRLVSEVPSYTGKSRPTRNVCMKLCYNDFIRPICLPFGLNLTEDGDKKYQVAGWGKTEHCEYTLFAWMITPGMFIHGPARDGVWWEGGDLSSRAQLITPQAVGKGACRK
uniref:Peptidase S1 domain-containing protein n=1 Tax=Timema shepardi TaxID=629360 RepID=A0A7R9ASK5_TIMSH|nr:unnamed protein product [Timema shepardi]